MSGVPAERPAGGGPVGGASTLVVGVGNPFRHDDAVGPAAIERLRGSHLDGVDLVEETGEPAALVQRWSGYGTVVLVDAVDSGSTAGSLHRFELKDGRWDAMPPSSVLSTHGVGVAHAVELARVLDRLPTRLLFYGVETEDVRQGVGLSAAVAAGLDRLIVELGELFASAAEQQAG